MNLKGKPGKIAPELNTKENDLKEEEETQASEKIKDDVSATDDSEVHKEKKESAWRKIAGIGLLITVLKCCIKGFTDTIVITVGDINPIVLIFFRSIIIFSLLIPMGLIKDQPPFPTSQTLKDRLLLVFRSIIGLMQVMANFYALQQMPLGVVKMIISTKPVFTLLFARVFLNESCDLLDGLSVLLMMCGVVTVLHPWDLQTSEIDSGYSEQFLLAAVLLFVSTGMASNIGIILRKLRGLGVLSLNSSRETIYIIITFIVIFSFGFELFTPSWKERLMILILGVCGLLTSSLNIIALKVEEASKVALVDRSSSIIIGFLIQILIFNELPSNITWVGFGLVMIAILIIGGKKIWKANNKKKVKKVEKAIENQA